MSEENKTLARKFFEMFELGNPRLADEIVAIDYINHNALAGQRPGIEGVKELVSNVKSGLPDVQFTIEDQIAERDKVVTRYTVSGTHLGKLFGISATGKEVNWTSTATMTVTNGKIQEIWLNWDQWGLMQQLGVVPSPKR